MLIKAALLPGPGSVPVTVRAADLPPRLTAGGGGGRAGAGRAEGGESSSLPQLPVTDVLRPAGLHTARLDAGLWCGDTERVAAVLRQAGQGRGRADPLLADGAAPSHSLLLPGRQPPRLGERQQVEAVSQPRH